MRRAFAILFFLGVIACAVLLALRQGKRAASAPTAAPNPPGATSP